MPEADNDRLDPLARPRARRHVPVRTAALWESVQGLAARRRAALGRPLRVLDLGGGSGGLAVPLAGLDDVAHVLVVDPSPDALASLRRRADEALGVGPAAERVSAVQGDADALTEIVGREGGVEGIAGIDLVTCHGTLEFVDDPGAALQRVAEVMAPGAALSLVSAQRLAAVLSRALAGRFAEALTVLGSPDGRWGEGDPAPRRFDRAALLDLVTGAGLQVVEVHGLRPFSDLVPAALADSDADRTALLALEQAAAAHPALAEIGTAIHIVAAR